MTTPHRGYNYVTYQSAPDVPGVVNHALQEIDADVARVAADAAAGLEAAEAAQVAMNAYKPVDGAASDFVNSWWCVPRSLFHELRGCYYQGGVNREGTMQVARFDLRRKTVDRIDLGTFEKDDHNVPALLFEDDQPPITAAVRHAVESFVRVRVGAAPHDLGSLADAPEVQVAFPGVCTYAHLIRRPGTDTVALLTRNSDGWYVAVSTDWGATWGTPRRFHGTAYCTFRLVGTVARYVMTGHPITTANNNVRYFEIDTVTGNITPAASTTTIGNLWSGNAVMTAASMTLVVQTTAPDSVRTFDVGRGGSVAAMRLNRDAPELGGTYGVYRYGGAGTWTWEPIVASGVPVGYYQSSYVGGMGFGGNDDSVWLARESAGTWTLERWVKNGTAWTLEDELQREDDGSKLGRPQIPWGAEGTGLVTGVHYWRYPSDTFMDYYGDQEYRETGIVEKIVPAPATAGEAPPEVPKTPVENLTTSGSLMLLDARALSSGVPTSSVDPIVGGPLLVTNTLTTADGKPERTGLGGLHVAISQTTTNVNRLFGFESQTVRDHLAANPAHAYYLAVLAVATRNSTASPPDSLGHRLLGIAGASGQPTTAVAPATGHKVTVVPSTYRTAYVETASPAPLGVPFIVDGAVSQVPAVGTSPLLVRFGTGAAGSTASTGLSWVLYTAYLEDLTISGRTYAQARALFEAAYPASAVSGDTWTPPATLAP